MTQPTSKEVAAAVKAKWEERAKRLHPKLKPHMLGYRRLQLEFYVGALTALNIAVPSDKPNGWSPLAPMKWVVNLIAGRPLDGEDDER